MQLRAELKISGYMRSQLLRYLEEALAEGYAQLRINGLREAMGAVQFPIQGGYVTVAAMQAEGIAIGTIVLGGQTLYVTMNFGRIPD